MVSLIGGKGQPFHRLLGARGQILFAVQEQLAKGILRELVSLIGGKGQPFHSLLGVRGEILFAVQEQLAKGILRELISLVGGGDVYKRQQVDCIEVRMPE